MDTSLKILILEDNIGDAVLCEEALVQIGFISTNINKAFTLREFNDVTKDIVFDVVLLDLYLPDSEGVSTFDSVRKVSPSSSIIILSGLTDRDLANHLVKSGAQDYLVKGEYDNALLEKTITHSLERMSYMKLTESSRLQYKNLFLNNPLPTLIVGLDTEVVVMANYSAESYYGIEESSLKGLLIHNLMKLPRKWNNWDPSAKLTIECQQFIPSQNDAIARVYIRKIEIESVAHWLVLLEDITDQIKFKNEKALLTSKIQDFERKKIAMELHDGIAQELTLLGLYMNQLEKSCVDMTSLQVCKRIVSDTIKQIRSLTYSIDPPLLDEGLKSGLIAFFNRLSRLDNIRFPFEIIGDFPFDFDHETSYNIFRIIQEFVNNSVKHSESNIIGCKIESHNEKVYFRLYDEGKGFDILDSNKPGMGLKNIYERAKAIGFEISYQSEIGKGTKMDLIIDCKNHND